MHGVGVHTVCGPAPRLHLADEAAERAVDRGQVLLEYLSLVGVRVEGADLHLCEKV